ncbi:MAG: hypothetical protein FJX72_17340 [Armatimonadetes bacterium]|nr:hypothetical protein [Armatimonadota bacterium]
MSVPYDGMLFPAVAGRSVEVHFDAGDITSDAGMLLVAQSDRRLGLTSALASVAQDRRQHSKVRHSIQGDGSRARLRDRLRQRGRQRPGPKARRCAPEGCVRSPTVAG